MKKFRDLNPGLKSRIGYEIDFEDYSLEELIDIFKKKVNDKGFRVTKEAINKVEKILKNAKEVENFGNGRFVENMVQRTIMLKIQKKLLIWKDYFYLQMKIFHK